MIISEKHTTAQTVEFARDVLRGMVPNGVIIVNPDAEIVRTMSTVDPTLGQLKIPCWLFMDYRIVNPVDDGS
jgi:hypothetical protein